MAGIHRQRPGADAIAATRGEPAVDLGDGVWLSPGLSNTYLLATDEGRIVVNTGMGFEGPLHRRVFDAVDSRAVRAVVLTQGHFDHVGGVDSFRGERTDVVAQANFATWRADNERLEAFRREMPPSPGSTPSSPPWRMPNRSASAAPPRPGLNPRSPSATDWISPSVAVGWSSSRYPEAKPPTRW